MENLSDQELWDKVDSLRDLLVKHQDETSGAYMLMVDQTDETLKQQQKQLYRDMVEKGKQIEQEICDLLDVLQTRGIS